MWGVGCGVWDVGFGVWGVGCRVCGVGCGVWVCGVLGVKYSVQDVGTTVHAILCSIKDVGFGLQGVRSRRQVQGLGWSLWGQGLWNSGSSPAQGLVFVCLY